MPKLLEKLSSTKPVRTKEQQEHFESVQARNLFLQSRGKEGKPVAVYTTKR